MKHKEIMERLEKIAKEMKAIFQDNKRPVFYMGWYNEIDDIVEAMKQSDDYNV